MLRYLLLPVLLPIAHLLAQDRPQLLSWPDAPMRSIEDTVRIDIVLDSMQLWLRAGSYQTVQDNLPELNLLLDGMGEKEDSPHLLSRQLQAAKLEGISHYYAGEYPAALNAFQGFQRVAERMGSAEHTAAALNYQSYQYRQMNDLPRARKAVQHAISILRTLPPGNDLANALTGQASVDTDEGFMDSALFHLREAVAIYTTTGNDMHRGSSLLNMADVFITTHHYDSAIVSLTKAIPLIEASGNMQYSMAAHVQHGRARYAIKDYATAATELAIAEELAAELEHDEALGRIHDVQALIAARTDDPLKAIELLRAGRDAMVRDLDLAKAQELTEVRLTAEHEREAAKAQRLLEEEKRQKRNTMIGGGSVALIAALLLWSLLSARRNAALLRSKNEEILRAQSKVVEVEKQRENEQVRTRIARDIHDDIGSGLTKIAMLGSDAKRRLSDASDDLRTSLDRIIGHSREVSAALSDIVWTVDPLHDTSAELVSHARMVTQRLLQDTDLRAELRFSHHDPGHPVSPNAKHHVMMVLKESLNNTMKYAVNSKVVVEFQAGAHRVYLRVTDDGPGFDTTLKGREGNGLRNMQKRAEAIGAKLSVVSSVGMGCTVEMQGPLS